MGWLQAFQNPWPAGDKGHHWDGGHDDQHHRHCVVRHRKHSKREDFGLTCVGGVWRIPGNEWKWADMILWDLFILVENSRCSPKKDRFPVIAICCMLSWLAYFRLLATLDVTKAFSNGCFTRVFIPQDLTTKRHSILLRKEDQSRAKVPNESLNDLSWFLNFNPTKIGPKNHALPLLSLSVWLSCRVYPMTPPVKTSGVTFNLRDFATITAWHPH